MPKNNRNQRICATDSISHDSFSGHFLRNGSRVYSQGHFANFESAPQNYNCLDQGTQKLQRFRGSIRRVQVHERKSSR